MSDKNRDPCKPFACRIQQCLKENNFQESACQKVIEEMLECCRKWDKLSFVCGGMNAGYSKNSKTTSSS